MWNTETKINRKSNLEKARIALKGTLKKLEFIPLEEEITLIQETGLVFYMKGT